MLQLLLFLSTRISNFGDSICQFAHGVLAFALFNRTRDFRSTPTLPAGPSLLIDSPIKYPGPSQSWSPRLSDDRSATDNGPDSFVAQGFSKASDILGFEGPMFIKLLIFVLVLSVISMPFVRNFGDLFDVLRSWAHSVPASLLASVHATGITKISHKDEELAKKLDSALQQIKHGGAQIQSLSADNRDLTSLAIEQGVDIRTQSDLINQLQGQLRDQGHNLEQAVSYWEQCERDVLTNSQEVARLEERLETLAVDSDMAQSASLLNRRHAQAREDRLYSALYTMEMHLSETQTSLHVSRESSLRQHEFFSSELETYAKQLDHWKTAAEQFETKVLESERDILNLRKELAVAYRNARDAKEQLESQTIILGERDATIRSLDRELSDVRDEVENAQYEIEGLRSDIESVDAAWKPLDSADAFVLTDELPAIPEWRGWLTEGTPDAPAMFGIRPQLVPHSPGMFVEELIWATSTPLAQSALASTEILSYPNIHVIRPTDPDDPFVDDYLPQSCSQLSSLSYIPRDVAASFAGPQSRLNNAEIIDESPEQLADEQLTRALIEDQVNLLQMKVLATEAVVVIQRRQLSSQQFQVSEEAAKNASLCEEARSLVVERNALAAKITVLEASLVERQAAEMAGAKAVDKAHAELEQAKEILWAYVNEVDAVKMERDELDMRLSQAAFLSSALQDRVATLERKIANAVVTPSGGPTGPHDGDRSVEQAAFLSPALQDRVEPLEQKIANAVVTPSDGPHDGDCRSEQAVFLSSALQDRVEPLEQKIANAVVTPSDGLHDGDCSLEQAIFLSSALQDRVEPLEQKMVNAVMTPSDGPHEGDCSLELVISGSIPYLLDISLPSLSSWGSVPDHPLSNPNPKLQPATTASKSGPRSRASPVSRRGWSPRPVTPPRNGCIFDGLVLSESSLSLLLASTPPMSLPGTPPVLPSPRFVFPWVPSPCPSTCSPRQEDISPKPILGRIGKRRSPPPPPTFRPPRPMGRRVPAPY